MNTELELKAEIAVASGITKQDFAYSFPQSGKHTKARTAYDAAARKMGQATNDFGGTDYYGAKGVARFTADGGEKAVYSFTTKWILEWKAEFNGAPDAVVNAALESAKRAAGITL